MERRSIYSLLVTALLLLGAGQAHVLASSSGTSQAQAKVGAAVTSAPVSAPEGASGSPRAPARAKLVDINSASSKQLMMLPGVTAAGAAKIVAGRPYGSKAQLVSRGAIDEATYQGLRQGIVARQPYKDSARNAALQARQK